MARFAVGLQDHGTRARLELHGMDVGTPQKKGLKHSMGRLIYITLAAASRRWKRGSAALKEEAEERDRSDKKLGKNRKGKRKAALRWVSAHQGNKEGARLTHFGRDPAAFCVHFP